MTTKEIRYKDFWYKDFINSQGETYTHFQVCENVSIQVYKDYLSYWERGKDLKVHYFNQ